MTKELEELKNIVAVYFGALGFLNPSENEQILKDRDKVLNTLTELQAIKNADSSEAMKCLEKLGTHRIEYREGFELGYSKTIPFKSTMEYKTIQQTLLKAQEQGLTESVSGRSFNKEILYLKQSIEQCNDKPIYYMSRSFGNKYIVPQELFENQAQELAKYRRAWEIVKEKKVDIEFFEICLEKSDKERSAFERYNGMFEDEEERQLTQEEFELLKGMLE